MALVSSSENEPTSSSEVGFTDTSIGGLAIVPASCPSSPDYAGQCDPVDPPGDSAPDCYLVSNNYNTYAGQQATLSWSSRQQQPWFPTYLGGSISPSVGSVADSGSTEVSPTQTTTYTYSGQRLHYGGTAAYSFDCDATITVTPAANCSFNGQTVLHGQSVTAYKDPTVAYGQSCNSQNRTCNNGNLTGSFAYSSCTVGPPGSCTFNGQTIAHGSSVTAYQQPNVPYGQSCNPQTRMCTNGSLSGSYQHSSCTPAGPPNAACSLNLNPSTVNQPNGATLSWSSANATSFYISGVGYVNPNVDGSTTVAPSQTTSYFGGAYGAGETGECSATLTVNRQCTTPWGATVTHGNSVTAWQASTVPYGSTCSSQTRSCSNGTLSGSYQYQSCSVQSPANCTLNGVTVIHGQSRTFYSVQTAPSGALCSSYTQSRTCTNGSLSGSSSYQYANCSCTPTTVYSCSPQNVVRTVTDGSCNVTVTNPYATCTSPAFCSAPSSVCLMPPPVYVPTPGGFTGELEARPSLVNQGNTSTLYWNVDNVTNCTITGTNNQQWTGADAGCNGSRCDMSAGKQTAVLQSQVTYTLACTAFTGGVPPSLSGSVIINVTPLFKEL